MKNYKYSIKKVIIGSAMGAAVLFGAAGLAKAQGNTGSQKPVIDVSAEDRAKLKGPDDVAKAKSAISIGYMAGLKSGAKDGGKSKKYNPSIIMPDAEESPSSASLSRNYKRFYEAGFTRGYEDGYNKTTKYGETSVHGNEKGYTVFAKILNELTGGSD